MARSTSDNGSSVHSSGCRAGDHASYAQTGFGKKDGGVFKVVISIVGPLLRSADKGAWTSIHLATRRTGAPMDTRGASDETASWAGAGQPSS